MCIWDLEFRFHQQRDWKDSVPGLPVKPKQYGHTVFCDIWAGFLQRAVHCAQNYQEGRLEHRFLGPPHTASGEAKLHLCSGTRISHKFPGNLDAVSHEGVVCAPSPHQGCQVWTQCLSHAKQVQSSPQPWRPLFTEFYMCGILPCCLSRQFQKSHHLLSKPKGLSGNNITETLLEFKLILNILFLLRKYAQLYLSQNEQLVLYLELDSLFYSSSVSYTASPCFWNSPCW